MNPGTELGAMPAKVSEKTRPMVTADSQTTSNW